MDWEEATNLECREAKYIRGQLEINKGWLRTSFGEFHQMNPFDFVQYQTRAASVVAELAGEATLR